MHLNHCQLSIVNYLKPFVKLRDRCMLYLTHHNSNTSGHRPSTHFLCGFASWREPFFFCCATLPDEILNVILENDIKRCYFGHLHGFVAPENAFIEYEGVKFTLVSADKLNFCPKIIENF